MPLQMSDLHTKYQTVLKMLSDPEVLDALSESDKRELISWSEHLKYEWEIHARPQQLPPPGNWTTWILMAGRGFGKTRVGSEAVRHYVKTGKYKAIGLIAPTASDARDVMIAGKGGSSLLEVTPEWEGLTYQPTKRSLIWENGAQGTSFSAEEPSRLRGPQHDLIWSDELAAWRYLQETWDMAMFGLRLGKQPKHIITTTPRPLPILKDLVKRAVPAEEMKPGMNEEVVITRGATIDNADNLAPQFMDVLIKKYEGTRLGRQELYAELLDDNPFALFSQNNIDMNRVMRESGALRPGHEVRFEYSMPQGAERPQKFKTVFEEIVVAVDPSMSSGEDADETGIIVMARDKADPSHIYVLEDASGRYSPNEWSRIVINLYLRYRANYVVAEINQGGDLVENLIRTTEKDMGVGTVDYKKVRASKGKRSRAEPVGGLEEQGRIHHLDTMAKLEEQLTEYQPGQRDSPDRLDAYVWGAHHLVVQREKKGFFVG